VVIAFWLRLDCLIKPCFLSASPLLSLYIALAFTHIISCSLRIPTPLLAFRITCALSRAHAHHRRTPSCAYAPSCAPLTSLSHRAPCAFLYPCVHPLSTRVLSIPGSVVAVPFRVERVCLRHSSIGAARPDILPHQQCC